MVMFARYFMVSRIVNRSLASYIPVTSSCDSRTPLLAIVMATEDPYLRLQTDCIRPFYARGVPI